MNKLKLCILIICTTILLTACDADKSHPIVSMYDQGHTTSDYFVIPTVHYDVTSEKESYSYLLQLCALNSIGSYYDYNDERAERRKAFQIQFSDWLDSIEFEGEFTKEQIKECFEKDTGRGSFSGVLSSVTDHKTGGLYDNWKWNFITWYASDSQFYSETQRAFLLHISEVLAPGELEEYLPTYYAKNNSWKTEDGNETWLKMHRFEGLLKLAKEPIFGSRTKDLIEKTETRLKDFTVIDPKEKPKHTYSYSSGGSSYGYSGDPYGAEDYDDPEDFADEWEDGFDSWEDAYDYWEDWDN